MKKNDGDIGWFEGILWLIALCCAIFSLLVLAQAYMTYVHEFIQYGQRKFEEYYVAIPLALGSISAIATVILGLKLKWNGDLEEDSVWIIWFTTSSVLSCFAFLLSVISALVHVF